MRSIAFRSAVLSCAAGSLIALNGCGATQQVSNPGSLTATNTTLASGGAGSVYALVGNSIPVVVQYSATTGGVAVPITSINLTQATIVDAVAVDKSTGTIYVAGYSNTDAQPEVWAYASGATGSPAPVRTIKMGFTNTTYPNDMQVDSAGNVYVSLFDINSGLGTVAEYSSTANGTATPLKSISGSSTGIANPNALAVDSAGTIYVASYTGFSTFVGKILVFGSTATGNVAPLRTITNNSGVFYIGLAVDANMNLYATQNSGGQNGVYPYGKIVKFAAGASGVATPVSSISSPALGAAYGLQVDSVGNVYVLNQTQSSSLSVLGFGPSSSSYLNPAVTLTPSALNSATTTSLAIK